MIFLIVFNFYFIPFSVLFFFYHFKCIYIYISYIICIHYIYLCKFLYAYGWGKTIPVEMCAASGPSLSHSLYWYRTRRKTDGRYKTTYTRVIITTKPSPNRSFVSFKSCHWPKFDLCQKFRSTGGNERVSNYTSRAEGGFGYIGMNSMFIHYVLLLLLRASD